MFYCDIKYKERKKESLLASTAAAGIISALAVIATPEAAQAIPLNPSFEADGSTLTPGFPANWSGSEDNAGVLTTYSGHDPTDGTYLAYIHQPDLNLGKFPVTLPTTVTSAYDLGSWIYQTYSFGGAGTLSFDWGLVQAEPSATYRQTAAIVFAGDNNATILHTKLSGSTTSMSSGSIYLSSGGSTTVGFLIASSSSDSGSPAYAAHMLIDNITFVEVPPAAVPEPSTYATLGAGLIALAFAKKRKERLLLKSLTLAK